MNELVFLMGKFEAKFPTDRRYCRNHMWITTSGQTHRFGLVSYAVRLLQDVYFLDWNYDPPATVARGQDIGSIESSKALSSLFAPIEGAIVRFNEALLEDPSGINADTYGAGWLFEMEGDSSLSMPVEEYLKFLDQHWEKTQKALSKQIQGLA